MIAYIYCAIESLRKNKPVNPQERFSNLTKKIHYSHMMDTQLHKLIPYFL
jgi:hypothetical protein